jgi:Pyruvate/2-oxoacid:ferredoxin oxidoreductase delta subunit
MTLLRLLRFNSSPRAPIPKPPECYHFPSAPMNSIVVLSIGQGSSPTEPERELAAKIADAGYQVWVTPHLYHLPGDDEVWDRIRTYQGRIAVLMWLHPRPAEWLLRARGIPPAGIAGTANWATHDSQKKVATWLSHIGVVPGNGSLETVGKPPLRERWYPVIDRDRCTNCRHCLQFCLFGVHSTSEVGDVIASSEDNCKTGCPACSRICPNGAIMFPMHAKDEGIAGAPGMLMSPDAEAKRMFYMRTGNPCPECRQSGEFRLTLESRKSATCGECGRPLVAAKPEPSPIHDEIDLLIGKLDQIAKKGS